MRFSLLYLAGVAASTAIQPWGTRGLNNTQSLDRKVFAHYMVGDTYGQELAQWQTDVADAKSAGIDGFALNIGLDSYTSSQLTLAYDAASSVEDFDVFLSFDMSISGWTVDVVASYIDDYKNSTAQFNMNGLPFVSTFEGPDWSSNWTVVNASTGGIFFVPDWSSLGATGAATKLPSVDGAFNWGAWPNANQFNMTTDADVEYQAALGDKVYMMGVSPYFYTDLPIYSKNWYSTSDTLWFARWKQALEILPDLIEIITWNDYGESSYINAPVAAQIVTGANAYVDGYDHTAFRFVLPYFIAAYKAGTTTGVELPAEGAMAWYRITPATICSDGDTVWGQGGTASAANGTNDIISIITLSNSESDLTVQIGSISQPVSASDSFGLATLYEVPFAGQAGNVTITVNGKSTTGPAITNACPASGQVNFNAVSIQV